MERTAFSTLRDSLSIVDEGISVEVPPDWRQGRTTYGGLSASICLQAAMMSQTALPPLRSAQFSFLGQADGRLLAKPTALREGKSAVFIGVDLVGSQGVAAKSTFCFASGRTSSLKYAKLRSPSVPPKPTTYEQLFALQGAPSYFQHFDGLLVDGGKFFSPGADPEMLVLARHLDAKAGDDCVALLALADVLPPPAMVMLRGPAPISTITWSVDFLSDAPASDEGWWLIKNAAESADAGYSTHTTIMWGERRRARAFR